MIKKSLFVVAIAAVLSGCDTLSSLPGGLGTTQQGPVTEREAGEGIRQALSQGISSAILALNKQDGFFGNEAYKLFLPEDVQKVERTLRNIGLGNQVDKAVLTINRAAEDAVGYAKPIFAQAIREMTIQDALNIVKGGKNSVTEYFRNKTYNQLISAFSPTIKSSLDKVEATKYYSDLVNAYNQLPTTRNKINPDLTAYVAERATNALFDQIAKEEENIRTNPGARTTEILKRVFGGL
jgi:hypothetical protein